jgi:hypothetical protein
MSSVLARGKKRLFHLQNKPETETPHRHVARRAMVDGRWDAHEPPRTGERATSGGHLHLAAACV